MKRSTPATTGPVTVCITQKVKPGYDKAFEAWLRGISKAAQQFPGHRGIEILRPSAGSQEYTYIFRFDNYNHLQKWETSPIRDQWVNKLQGLTEATPKKQILTGLEYWFTLPSDPAKPAPPRYKMVIITILAIYPLTTLLSRLATSFLGTIPLLLRGLIISVLAVLLMTYVIMPRLIRLFAKWLFPKHS